MKPYFEDESVTIYHGDCREVLPELSRVDLLLTDPPYGVQLRNNGRVKNRRSQRHFDIVGDCSQDMGQCVIDWAASQEIAVIAFANPMKAWAGEWRQWLVWDKGGAVGGGGDRGKCWKQTWELIQVARTPELQGNRDSAVLSFYVTPHLSADHIAAKPVALIRYLIAKVNASLVLDPFMGTGTTLRAAKDLGMRAIGIEIEERYCEIAAKRMAQQVLPIYEGVT